MLDAEIPESFKQGMREIPRGEVIELDEALEELGSRWSSLSGRAKAEADQLSSNSQLRASSLAISIFAYPGRNYASKRQQPRKLSGLLGSPALSDERVGSVRL